MSNVLPTLGAQVRHHRLIKNMTQAELAQRSGLTRTSIANVEAGRQNVRYTVLCDIAAALDVPVSAITSTVVDLRVIHRLVSTATVNGDRKTISYRCAVRGCGTSGRISTIPATAADDVFALAVRAHDEETSVPATVAGQEGTQQ